MPATEDYSQNHPSLKPLDAASGKNGGTGQQFSFKKTPQTKTSQPVEKSENSRFVANKQADEKAGNLNFSDSPKNLSNEQPRPRSGRGEREKPAAAELAPPVKMPQAKNRKTNGISVATEKKRKKVSDNWLERRGHAITYALLFAFTFVLYFRPYELIPGMTAFSSIALILAVATILTFVPSQLAAESSLTARPSEVNYILLLAVFGILTIPIARSPLMAWETFYDPFIKVVLMFVVMINVVRTEARLKGLIWLGLAVGIMLAVNVLQNYSSGKLLVEESRAMADINGMFGNPNAQALHFVTVTPIAVALAFAAKSWLMRLVYAAMAVLFVAGNSVTFSRGGFLGLIASSLVLAWKLGRENRFRVMAASAFCGLLFILLAPGNYGLRVLSIFIPSLDPVGSSTQRQDLLWTSIIVTLRNPWGIGMNNFTLVNARALVTHNSYTQVSAEMGVLALVCYILFIVTPYLRLGRIEQELYETGNEKSWIYYLAIGLQVSLVGFAVGSAFDSAAYQWFLYYIVAYAVCLRRVYQLNPVQSSRFKVQSQT